MVGKEILQEYIDRLDTGINSNDTATAKTLQKEIISGIGVEVTGLKHGLTSYKWPSFGTFGGKTYNVSLPVDYIKDAKTLRKRLEDEFDNIENSNRPIDIQAEVDLPHEFISACAKIADNPVSYDSFDEDGLNREVRNFLDSAITRFGYTIADQTQQGFGKTEKKAGELDIRISKNGIPVAIYEGLLHDDKDWLNEHIDKAIGKYNQSGCKAVYIVELYRNERFGVSWNHSIRNIVKHPKIMSVKEENTDLLGVKMLKGTFDWEGQKGDFYYIGVNCYVK